MNADHIEPFVTDCGEAVRRCGSDHHNVAGGGNDLFSIDDHCRLTSQNDARFWIRILMQPGTFSR